MGWFDKPVKTEKKYTDFLGRRVREVHYADTGKTVKRVTTDNFFSNGKTTKTYVKRSKP